MLKSKFFTILVSREASMALQQCQVSDPHHITRGASGCHVQHIQLALIKLSPTAGNSISKSEIEGRSYGPTTAAAVLSYKKQHGIINPAYQKTADDIVGKMTITHLDNALATVGW